jgi:hypothetical protein
MADPVDQHVLADFARGIVADVAPQELPLFRPLSQAYFKDPARTLKGGGGADKMLGFGGMAAVGTLMTPMILRTSQVALDALVTGFTNQVQTEIQRIESWLADARARPETAATIAPPGVSTAGGVPPEIAGQIEQIVARQLAELNCPAGQCDVLASKICGSLFAGQLAADALARERARSQQAQKLKIEIDEIRKAEEVSRIVQSDQFAVLCRRAAELRRQSGRR